MKFNSDGSTNQLADRIDGLYHNHPYDLDVDRHNRIWFSDPYSSIPTPGPQIFPPLDFCAILRQEPSKPQSPAWVIQRMTFDTMNPRAILLSQDDQTLYVAEHSATSPGLSELRAYPIQENGSLETPRIIQSFDRHLQGINGGVAGMCLDSRGNIVACGNVLPGSQEPGVTIYSPKGGNTRKPPRPIGQPTHCGFGGPQWQSLFITTEEGKLYRVDKTDRRGWGKYQPGVDA